MKDRVKLCPDCGTVITRRAGLCRVCAKARFAALRAVIGGCRYCGRVGGVCTYSDGDCAPDGGS